MSDEPPSIDPQQSTPRDLPNGPAKDASRMRLAFLATVLLGVVLRLVWVGDMEWKGDEIYSFEKSQAIGREVAWPAVGMGTSVGLPNPGFSIWAFVPIGRLAPSPTGLCRCVMLLNVAALLGFAVFAARGVEPGRREVWLWAVALLAVNPYAVRIARKIWPPSLLPPLVLLLCVGHRYRRTRSGAFAWGLAGAVLGQIHLSGFFLAGGIFAWTVLDMIRGRVDRRCRWAWWVLGSLAGAAGLLPWLQEIRLQPSAPFILGWSAESFYLRITVFYAYWFDLAFGQSLYWTYYGGVVAFLSGPSLLGYPTYLLQYLQDFLFWAGLFGVVMWAWESLVSLLPRRWRAVCRRRIRLVRRRVQAHIPEPARPRARRIWFVAGAWLAADPPSGRQPIAEDPEARLLAGASSVGSAILVFLLIRIIHFHYLFIFCPLIFVWVVRVFARRRRLLGLIVVAQALLTLASLVDLHERGGAEGGDYGVSYSAQLSKSRGSPAQGP